MTDKNSVKYVVMFSESNTEEFNKRCRLVQTFQEAYPKRLRSVMGTSVRYDIAGFSEYAAALAFNKNVLSQGVDSFVTGDSRAIDFYSGEPNTFQFFSLTFQDLLKARGVSQ